MCGSGNIGDHTAYFEPIQGSAPRLSRPRTRQIRCHSCSARQCYSTTSGTRGLVPVCPGLRTAFAERAIELDTAGPPSGGTWAVT